MSDESTVTAIIDNATAKRADLPDVSVNPHTPTTDLLRLHLRGWSYGEIGAKYGIKRQTVAARLGRFRKLLLKHGDLDAFKAHEPDLLRAVDLRLLRAIVDKVDHRKTTLGHLAFAKDKIFNHIRLLEGKSTANVATLTKLVLEAHLRGNSEPEAGAVTPVEAPHAAKSDMTFKSDMTLSDR